MKKVVIIILVSLVMYNCSDEVRFNSPAMQAHKNGNVLWKTQFRAADIDNGGYVIEGRNSGEVLQLITTDDTRGTFEIGLDTGNIAIFVDIDGTVYSSENMPDPSVSIYPPTGQIIVDDIDNDDPKNIFGTFWFYAYTADGLNAVNFNEGVFYKIPLVGGLVQVQ
ncbi:MAG: hypothetical protein DA407_04130 [Bacteroidetes bacterium]|nr:MAG: hypothetical protein DA407_04130 [Bacteroidota bacterium]